MGNCIKDCCEAFTNSLKIDNENKISSMKRNNLKEVLISSNKRSSNLNNQNNINNEISQRKVTFREYNSESNKIGMEISLHDFRILKTLGKGSFGKVILVQHVHLKNYYAMKILQKEQLKQTNQIVHTKSEREILEKISHPFIIKLIFAFQNPKKLFIVTEYMCGGEIFYHLRKEEKFQEERTRLYIAEIVLALEHLHINGIIYRDLKPENILLDRDGHIKLTDFGLSKILKSSNLYIPNSENINKDSNSTSNGFNEINTSNINNNLKDVTSLICSFNSGSSRAYTICGTPEYLAPEILNGKGYDKAVDWWSLGVVAYEMLCGYSPYKENKFKLDINIYKRPLVKEKFISHTAFDLLKKLLDVDQNKRLGSGLNDAEEIKKHPFFKGLNWDKVFKKKYKPLFIPKIKYDEDLTHFDKMFTDEDPKSSNEKLSFFNKQISDNKYDDFTYVNKFLT